MGERTPLALLDAPASARMAVGEAITNLAGAEVGAAHRGEALRELDGRRRPPGRGRRALRHREGRRPRALPRARHRHPGRQGLDVDAHRRGRGGRAEAGRRAALADRLVVRAGEGRAPDAHPAAPHRPGRDGAALDRPRRGEEPPRRLVLRAGAEPRRRARARPRRPAAARGVLPRGAAPAHRREAARVPRPLRRRPVRRAPRDGVRRPHRPRDRPAARATRRRRSSPRSSARWSRCARARRPRSRPRSRRDGLAGMVHRIGAPASDLRVSFRQGGREVLGADLFEYLRRLVRDHVPDAAAPRQPRVRARGARREARSRGAGDLSQALVRSGRGRRGARSSRRACGRRSRSSASRA